MFDCLLFFIKTIPYHITALQYKSRCISIQLIMTIHSNPPSVLQVKKVNIDEAYTCTTCVLELFAVHNIALQ